MVRPVRLERTTLCLEGRCSIQLSYGRTLRRSFSLPAVLYNWHKPKIGSSFNIVIISKDLPQPSKTPLLHPPFLNQTSKMLKRPIIRPLRIRRETARRQLPHLQMVLKALTTHTLPRTGRIRTIAPLQVFLFLALHCSTPPFPVS